MSAIYKAGMSLPQPGCSHGILKTLYEMRIWPPIVIKGEERREGDLLVVEWRCGDCGLIVARSTRKAE